MHLIARTTVTILTCLGLSVAAPAAAATDWPMWRSDASRSGAVEWSLPDELHLQWVKQLPAPEPAWPITQYKLQFDASYEPVVAGQRLFVASMSRDSVTAYNTRTGTELWRFYADGPVRFAPVVWEQKVYFVSDDGHLYCLDAADGALRWKFQAAPNRRTVLGNGRLVSIHPARGAPVVYDGKVYFAAGVYPFMGAFVHALDAQTGEVVWTNSHSGSVYILQPHSSPAFAGVSPQGYLAATDKYLIVSGGRSVPACYDRTTGEFLHYRANTKEGRHMAWTAGEWIFNDGRYLKLNDGWARGNLPADVRFGETIIGINSEGTIVGHELNIPIATETRVTRRGQKRTVLVGYPKATWRIDAGGLLTQLHFRAGQTLYGSNNKTFAAIKIPSRPSQFPDIASIAEITWHKQLDAPVSTMLAGDDRLFVVTGAGAIYCYGRDSASASPATAPAAEPPIEDEWTAEAGRILARNNISAGYALCLGLGTGRLAEELVTQSDLNVIVIDPDAEAVDSFRRKMDAAGLYGRRVSVQTADLYPFDLPPYLVSLIVSERPWDAHFEAGLNAERLIRSIRPYGGVACLKLGSLPREAFARRFNDGAIDGAEAHVAGGYGFIRRPGPLRGAGSWTHENGDAANTVFSPDQRVKAPLGLLWFGGPSHQDVLPRHGHGPAPQVAGGRVIIQGIGVISARDVYTGRVLWRREMETLNTYDMYYNKSYVDDIYDRTYNQRHMPGAGELGGNFVTTTDRVYLIAGPICHVLDAATGETVTQFTLSPTLAEDAKDRRQANWGTLLTSGDLLIATAEPYRIIGDDRGRSVVETWNARYGPASRKLVVMNRHTGKILWERAAAMSFRHNSIIVGGGKVFCIDGISPAKRAMLRRRGVGRADAGSLLALDLHTGRQIWAEEDDVFGTWLAYSAEYDIVLQAGSAAKDRASDEVGEGMSAFGGSNGKPLWRIDGVYFGPPMLHHRLIITQPEGATQVTRPAKAYDLLTGVEARRVHPLTGRDIPWSWIRYYGCNTAIASEHLLSFRSASAAIVDMTTGQGTASLGGFKSGCTTNLIVADGVLNAPDYTRTCICSYQNQASVALVHAPEVETWSVDDYPPVAEPTAALRIGLNLGAPGNRFGPDGTLWLEHPSIAGPSPDVPAWVVGAEAPGADDPSADADDDAGGGDLNGFAAHSGYVTGPINWVGATGVRGLRRVTVRPFLQPSEPSFSPEGVRRVPGFATTRHKPATWLPENVRGRFPAPRAYTVRLVFAEPDVATRPGDRVFSVAIQGQTVLADFDVAAAAGGNRRTVIRQFQTTITDDLTITLEPVTGEPILCGIELIAE